ncbi:hypothetical protein FWJ25_18510 [Marinobacter salinexigens]|uniref:SbsA Ig-like domain-containing protein n=1 Tax=Marinobacter salinexigens TaxID=2919747 RepID=A0A5B0V8G1_9GAMM|nr:Ig-like domain-containing protein [Marinobacter salinexigens]KAA1170718.1 hypothetical protein FWJ25_18510 [Marinobacter salinexigens]
MKKYNKTIALAPAILLAACGGGSEQVIDNSVSETGSVIYSYPADGQTMVSPRADIVLRFSHAITDENITSKIELTNAQGSQVPYSVTAVDGGRSLVLSPDTELDLSTEYTISISEPLMAGVRQISNPNAMGDDGVQFSTRAGFTGSQGLDSLNGGTFSVTEMLPSSDGFFKPMDFSSFLVTLSEPAHPDWKAMGGTIRLLDSSGEEVSSDVYLKGRYLTVDPCTADTRAGCGMPGDVLTAGEEYTLEIAGLPSLSGQTLNYSASFTPKDTSPTVILYQETIDSGLIAGTAPVHSILNDQIINGVSLNSVLQGVTDTSQQTGGLYAELAYGPSFPGDEPVPLRVPKGSLLESTSLDVRINGTVPVIDPTTGSIQKTGTIKVTMLSDALGYLYPNPYSDSAEAPRHVKLFMDVSMNTEEAQPNASLSQDLMHVELSGIAIVKGGVLTIDAIGMVEPNLLGQEFTDSTIAFHIEADTNAAVQLDALDNRTADTTGPSLVSWMPGPSDAIPPTRQLMQRPGDPITLNFDEPLNQAGLTAGITLFADGTAIPGADVQRKLDGTVVVLNPVGGLEHGVEYSVQINNELTDLAGNSATSQTLTFTVPEITAPGASPIALTTYPGFPCVTTGVDLGAGTHGQCVDAAPGGPAGDILPITTIPEDRPLTVVFSQSMDLDSIRNGETFLVEQINADGSVAGEVSGRLEKNNQRIRFYPDSAWEVDSFYRYTIASSTAVNDCGAAVCSEDGYPLQTDLLVDPQDIGGPDLEIYFKGIAATGTVYTPLRNLPIRDTNSNYLIDGCASLGATDCVEPFAHESDGAGGYLPSENAAKLAVVNKEATALGLTIGASVGCAASESCPKNKFIYQTYGLNTEIIGPAYDEEGNNIGIRVLLYPTMLATTSASVFLDGFGENATGPQVLRMRYGTPTEDNPLGLVEGIIVEGEDGNPTFQTVANLTLDAPNLQLPLASALSHDLYSKPFTLELSGPILFFDDGRMQIEQRNLNEPPIEVNVEVEIPILGGFMDFFQCVSAGNSLADCLSGNGTDSGDISIPLIIPQAGIWLNFISNPVKEIPAVQ